MNRSAIVLIAVLVAVILVFKFCNSRPDRVTEARQAPITISKNSGAFDMSFRTLLNAYYALKDAFVLSDSVKADSAAGRFIVAADSLKVDEIKGDSTGMIRETAQSFTATMVSSATAIQGEKTLEGKRRELNMITDALWSLTRTVKFDGEKVYYQFCPMAFKNQGAYWLSNKREIRNPYYGDEMPTCGENTDSVDYGKH